MKNLCLCIALLACTACKHHLVSVSYPITDPNTTDSVAYTDVRVQDIPTSRHIKIFKKHPQDHWRPLNNKHFDNADTLSTFVDIKDATVLEAK